LDAQLLQKGLAHVDGQGCTEGWAAFWSSVVTRSFEHRCLDSFKGPSALHLLQFIQRLSRIRILGNDVS
jgi:hypothetical protein